jgi:2-polyprenyl-6-methoxyphenol hydroxylase-like FAD-dependent oxidoreductase
MHVLKGDYDAASPCSHIDLPQTLLEPVLLHHATQNGFRCRFDTTFVSFVRKSSDEIISTIKDNLTNETYEIRSKYLFGCDGARSQILRQLQIPLIKKPGQGLAINVLVKADLSSFVKSRMGNLHWVMSPDAEYPPFAWMAVVRMVKPWNE